MLCKLYLFGYFNSQPHKEADDKEEWEELRKIISTHSLTRRLTNNWIDF